MLKFLAAAALGATLAIASPTNAAVITYTATGTLPAGTGSLTAFTFTAIADTETRLVEIEEGPNGPYETFVIESPFAFLSFDDGFQLFQPGSFLISQPDFNTAGITFGGFPFITLEGAALASFDLISAFSADVDGFFEGESIGTVRLTASLDAIPGEPGIPGQPGAVPEPATWAMMILGFGVAGGAIRRTRRRVSVAYA